MKNKHWALLLGVLLFVCISASILFMGGNPTNRAEISSNGEIVRTVDLNIDQEFTVATDLGSNTVTVKDGRIAVTAASCPDHYCMQRGFCNSGAQIVCLPNRLVITFLDAEAVDFAVG